MRSLRFYKKNFFMYAESLRSPRCQGQSILIKETPTPVHLQYTYTNERKECLLTQITKERWCQYQLTSLLYRTLFRLSALFSKFSKNKKRTSCVFDHGICRFRQIPSRGSRPFVLNKIVLIPK